MRPSKYDMTKNLKSPQHKAEHPIRIPAILSTHRRLGLPTNLLSVD